MPIRVLVVDDSALVRKVLSDLLSQDPEIEVVGTAVDGAFALRKVQELRPDVITLDVEMRQMNGIEVLNQLMRENPLPVVMVSSHTQQGAEATFKALEAGAVDFVPKPGSGGLADMAAIGEVLVEKVKAAAKARLRPRFARGAAQPVSRPAPAKPVVPMKAGASPRPGWRPLVIAVGASTGGTEALSEFFTRLPPGLPPVVVVQHMPETFTATFAQRLNSLSQVEVKEAQNGDTLAYGKAFIAPGNYQMSVERLGAGMRLQVEQSPLVNRHRPSVEVLFNSVAKTFGRNTLGIIMTGMGADGAVGMLNLHKAGAYNIAQDEDSCVVFGMPKEAIALGGVDVVLPLNQIAEMVFVACRG